MSRNKKRRNQQKLNRVGQPQANRAKVVSDLSHRERLLGGQTNANPKMQRWVNSLMDDQVTRPASQATAGPRGRSVGGVERTMSGGRRRGPHYTSTARAREHSNAKSRVSQSGRKKQLAQRSRRLDLHRQSMKQARRDMSGTRRPRAMPSAPPGRSSRLLGKNAKFAALAVVGAAVVGGSAMNNTGRAADKTVGRPTGMYRY